MRSFFAAYAKQGQGRQGEEGVGVVRNPFVCIAGPGSAIKAPKRCSCGPTLVAERASDFGFLGLRVSRGKRVTKLFDHVKHRAEDAP
jgi:hypothetical protein